jgi:hypothetical protein
MALFAACLAAQTPPPADSPTIPKLNDVNSEILHLVIQDQWDRGVDMFGGRTVRRPESLDGREMQNRDEQRRNAVSQLLAAGGIQSGKDYHYAALVFQHGGKSQHYLLAHMLATTAAAKGESNAKWLAAATLDRYLWSLKQPQVFGTQFMKSRGEPFSMEPYDRTTLSDAMRALWCVISSADQERLLKDAQDGKPLRSTSDPQCR